MAMGRMSAAKSRFIFGSLAIVFSTVAFASAKATVGVSDYFLGAGGLLPRPGPEGLPVLLGPFLRWVVMVILQKMPRKKGVRGPRAYLADACYKMLRGKWRLMRYEGGAVMDRRGRG